MIYAHKLYLDGELIKDLVIPNSVISIEKYAFNGCDLTSVTIPNSVCSIGERAFYNCSDLSLVTIPNSVTNIGDYAFSFCSSLTSITIPNSVTDIKMYAFSGSGLVSVTIPNSVTSIKEGVFKDCHSLTSVSFPNSLNRIGGNAFEGCTGLTSVTYPNSLTSIGGSAFKSCTGLTSVIIPNSVTSIIAWAFHGCSSLTSVTIGNSVASIGLYAFANCKELTDVYCYAENVPSADNSFYDSYIEYATLYVPKGCKAKYESAYVWKDFKEILEIEPESIFVQSITLNQTDFQLSLGDTYQLSATVLPDDATDKSITWSSSDESIASISEDGTVIAKGIGTATITATTNDGSNITASCFVTVNPILVSEIILSDSELSLKLGDIYQLSVAVLPDDATDKSITWSSSDESVASISDDGTVIAKGSGSATITATTNDGTNLSATCEVTVTDPVVLASSIEIIPSTLSLYTGESKTVTVKILPENVTDDSFTWGCTNWDVVTIDDNGVVSAISAGEASICAIMQDGSDKVAFCQVTVTDPTVWATDIQLDYADLTLVRNETVQLTATVLPENTTDNTVKWASNKPTIASVDDNGLVTAKKVGTATITAKTNDGTNLKAQCVVTVKPILVESIELNYSSYTLDVGESVQLTAIVLPEDADDKTVNWESGDKNIVEVNDGLVSFCSVGSSYVYAIANDGSEVRATCYFTTINGIEEVHQEATYQYFYTVDGNRASKAHNGFYIIKNEDGSVQKVMVK